MTIRLQQKIEVAKIRTTIASIGEKSLIVFLVFIEKSSEAEVEIEFKKLFFDQRIYCDAAGSDFAADSIEVEVVFAGKHGSQRSGI